MNYRAIVQFHDDKLRIDGLYCVAVQITAEYNGESKELALYADEEDKQYLHFGDDILSAYMKEYSLYLERTGDIEIIELVVVPVHPAFDINTNPHVGVKIVDNQIQLMSMNKNDVVTRADIVSLVSRINNEAVRRNASGSVNPVTYRATNPATNQVISAGSRTAGGTYANIASPLNQIQAVSNPTARTSKIVYTGAGSFQYLSSLVTTLAAISPTASSSGCSSSCTGLCSNGCYSGCSSCSGSCQGTCQGGCSTTCTGGCTNSCSGCGGACSSDCTGYYGCGGDCTYEPGIGECC